MTRSSSRTSASAAADDPDGVLTAPAACGCRARFAVAPCFAGWRARPAWGESQRVLVPGAERSEAYPAVVNKCPHCLLQQRVCLCAEVPAIATRTRIVIVRHHLERFRSSNSGRLAHLALT